MQVYKNECGVDWVPYEYEVMQAKITVIADMITQIPFDTLQLLAFEREPLTK